MIKPAVSCAEELGVRSCFLHLLEISANNKTRPQQHTYVCLLSENAAGTTVYHPTNETQQQLFSVAGQLPLFILV